MNSEELEVERRRLKSKNCAIKKNLVGKYNRRPSKVLQKAATKDSEAATTAGAATVANIKVV